MRFFYLIFILLLISCSENGDKYIGNYKSKYRYTIIKKSGNEGYFLTFGNYNEENTLYCIYKKGCFVSINKKGEFPLMCINGNSLISNEGITYKKVEKIK